MTINPSADLGASATITSFKLGVFLESLENLWATEYCLSALSFLFSLKMEVYMFGYRLVSILKDILKGTIDANKKGEDSMHLACIQPLH